MKLREYIMIKQAIGPFSNTGPGLAHSSPETFEDYKGVAKTIDKMDRSVPKDASVDRWSKGIMSVPFSTGGALLKLFGLPVYQFQQQYMPATGKGATPVT